MSDSTVTTRLRSHLTSRKAILAYRIILALVAMPLLIDAIKTAQVYSLHGIDWGSNYWYVVVLYGVSSAVGVICLILMGFGWAWSVWLWACTVTGIAIAGLVIGLNVEFATRWDVLLPWIVLAYAAWLKSRFAAPWR